MNPELKSTIDLLSCLIRIESFSGNEHGTATCLEEYLTKKNIPTVRKGNNVWSKNKCFSPTKPTLLLNSHHDTVKPNSAYTHDPFFAHINDEKLYGLGSNDAGASLVCLLQTFLKYYARTDLPFNIIYAATAEEENSGINGVSSILDDLGKIALAVVGEPTEMHVAIAEKGLLVIDCYHHGIAGHAARNEGENALYKALADIEWFRNFRFPEVSTYLGEVKMTVTMIEAGIQHNIIPERCKFTVDIRSTDKYTHDEILKIISERTSCKVVPRSFRLNPSCIPETNPIVKAAIKLGRNTYGSPTTSDQALMNFPSIKMGPGNSERSHSANEFIYLSEIDSGLLIYDQLMKELIKTGI